MVYGLRTFNSIHMKHYFKEIIETRLDTLLASMPEAERKEAKRQIKLKLLESYRNGFDKLSDKFEDLTQRFRRYKQHQHRKLREAGGAAISIESEQVDQRPRSLTLLTASIQC